MSSRLTLPCGPSNSYAFSTAIHGIRRRSAARASRARVAAFSLTSICSRAAAQASGDTIGGVFIPGCPLRCCVSLALFLFMCISCSCSLLHCQRLCDSPAAAGGRTPWLHRRSANGSDIPSSCVRPATRAPDSPAGDQLQPWQRMKDAHQHIHRDHSSQWRRVMRRRAKQILRGADDSGQQRHDCERWRTSEAQTVGCAEECRVATVLDHLLRPHGAMSGLNVSHGRTCRGGATTCPCRCAPWARDRATGTCPKARRVRAHRRSRCGRRRRPRARTRSCRAAGAGK